MAFKDSQAAEEELVQNGPEVDEGRPDELKSTVAQKRADLVIYQQQVSQCLQLHLQWIAATTHSLSYMCHGRLRIVFASSCTTQISCRM